MNTNTSKIINYKSSDISQTISLMQTANEEILNNNNWFIDKSCVIAITSNKKNWESYNSFIVNLVEVYPNIKILLFENEDQDDRQQILRSDSRSKIMKRQTDSITCKSQSDTSYNESDNSSVSCVSDTNTLQDLGTTYSTNEDQFVLGQQKFEETLVTLASNITIVTSHKKVKDYTNKIRLLQNHSKDRSFLLVIDQSCAPIFTKLQIPKLFADLIQNDLTSLEIYP